MSKEKPVILYAEDEDLIRMLVTKFLSKHFEVITACDGSEALNLFKSAGADALITDLTMPNMNGLELIKAVKEMNSGLPVFVTTAHAEEYENIEGVSRIYAKPIDCKSMIETIKEQLQVV